MPQSTASRFQSSLACEDECDYYDTDDNKLYYWFQSSLACEDECDAALDQLLDLLDGVSILTRL